MKTLAPVLKDPDAVRTYGFFWGNNLTQGDTLASVAWTVPAGLTLVSQGVNASPVDEDGRSYATGTVAMVRLSGGSAGTDYPCVCHITTTNGDADERTLTVLCRER